MWSDKIIEYYSEYGIRFKPWDPRNCLIDARLNGQVAVKKSIKEKQSISSGVYKIPLVMDSGISETLSFGVTKANLIC